MTDLQTRIEQFLATAYSPDNPLTARDKLDQAVGLLQRVKNAQYQIAVIPDGVDDFLPIFDLDMTPPKPEDRL